jgi:hypothetical protein
MEFTKQKGTITGINGILIFFILSVCPAIFFKLVYTLPLRDSFLWYAGSFFSFYIPGNLVLRYVSLNKDEYFMTVFHSLALGVAVMPLVYAALRRISHPELLYPMGIILFLIWLIVSVRDLKSGKFTISTSFTDIMSALVLIVSVCLLLHLTYFTDVIFFENGFKIRNTYLNESIFHLGIVNVLKSMFPPLYPYASGVSFSHYHLSMHLEMEMFNRLFSLDTIKLTFFYFPFLYFCLLVFMPFLFIRNSVGVRLLAVVTGILMFGSDLSFIPGVLGMSPPQYPWNDLFRNTIWSLLTLNSNLPAVIVLFLCILYLKKFYEDGTVSYLLVFSLLGFSAYTFKSSTGPHIMGAAFLTGIASTVLTKDRKKGWLVCAVSVLTVLVIAIDLFLIRGTPSHYIIRIDLLNNFYRSLKRLGISNMVWFFLLLVFPIYILASFGARAFGLYVIKDTFKKKFFDPIVFFLLMFTVSGFILSEVLFIGFPHSKVGTLNNAGWFAVQSLMGAWLLVAFFLAKQRIVKKRYFIYIVLVILLSAPSTIQFLTLRHDTSYYTVDGNANEVVRYLETTKPDAVVLHPPNLDGPSLSANLAGRQSVLSFLQSYVLQMIGQEEGDKRLADIESFFNPRETNTRSSILTKYNVNYVYAPASYADFLDGEPMLSNILKNNEYVVYSVNGS